MSSLFFSNNIDQSLTPETSYATPMDQSISPENETQDSLSISQKRKRHQVKLACMACRKRHAACDDTRPCKQCVKHNTLDQCVDRPRKKRRASVDMGAKHNILEQSPYGRRAFSVDFSSMRNNENEFVFCDSELPQYQSRFPVEQSKPLRSPPHESFVNTYSIPQYTKTSNTITPLFNQTNEVPNLKTDNMSPLTNNMSPNANSPVFDPNDIDTSVTDLEAYAVNLSMDDLVTVPHALFRDVITRNFSMRSQISSMSSEIADLKNTVSENQSYIQHLREQQQLQQQQIQKQQQQLHHQQQLRGIQNHQQIQSYLSNFSNYANIPTYHPSKNSRMTQRRYSISEGNPRFYQQYQSLQEKFQQPQPLQVQTQPSPQPLSTYSQQPLMNMLDQQSNEQECQNDDSYQDISDQEEQYVQYSSQYSPQSFPYSINQQEHGSPKQTNQPIHSSQPQPLQSQPQPYQSQPQPYQSQPQPYQSQPQPYQSQPQPYQSQPQQSQPQQPQPYQSQPQQPQPQPQQSPQPYQSQPQPYQPYQSQPQPLQSQISQSIQQYCSEYN